MTRVSLSSGSEEPLDALCVGTRRVVSGPFSVGTWRVSSSSPRGPVLRRSSRPSPGLSVISLPLYALSSAAGRLKYSPRFYPAHVPTTHTDNQIRPHTTIPDVLFVHPAHNLACSCGLACTRGHMQRVRPFISWWVLPRSTRPGAC